MRSRRGAPGEVVVRRWRRRGQVAGRRGLGPAWGGSWATRTGKGGCVPALARPQRCTEVRAFRRAPGIPRQRYVALVNPGSARCSPRSGAPALPCPSLPASLSVWLSYGGRDRHSSKSSDRKCRNLRNRWRPRHCGRRSARPAGAATHPPRPRGPRPTPSRASPPTTCDLTPLAPRSRLPKRSSQAGPPGGDRRGRVSSGHARHARSAARPGRPRHRHV